MELEQSSVKAARSFSRKMRRVLTENLHARRAEAGRHDRERAEQARAREEDAADLKIVMDEAKKGVRNLLAVYNNKAMKEAIALHHKVHGNSLTLFRRETDFGIGVDGRWSSAEVYVERTRLYIHVDQGLDGNNDSKQYTFLVSDFTRSGSDGDYETTIEEELGELLCLHRPKLPYNQHMADDRWIIEAALSIDVFELEEEESYERKMYALGGADKLFLTWLAFLVACADEEKLARLMERAFKKLEAAQ
jgi:hypothetical protein